MKYLRSTISGCEDIGIRKSEFVAKTQFLWQALHDNKFKTILEDLLILKYCKKNFSYLCLNNPQCKPESSGIGRRLLDSSYHVKKSNEHETQNCAAVNTDPFHLINYYSKTICFVTTLN